MVLLVTALVVVGIMVTAGPALGQVAFPGCGGVDYAQGRSSDVAAFNKSSPVLFENCGTALPPGQKVREAA